MKWNVINEETNLKSSMYLVKANKTIFIMHYGLNPKGDMVWWLDEEEVWKKHLQPTHYIRAEDLLELEEQ